MLVFAAAFCPSQFHCSSFRPSRGPFFMWGYFILVCRYMDDEVKATRPPSSKFYETVLRDSGTDQSVHLMHDTAMHYLQIFTGAMASFPDTPVDAVVLEPLSAMSGECSCNVRWCYGSTVWLVAGGVNPQYSVASVDSWLACLLNCVAFHFSVLVFADGYLLGFWIFPLRWPLPVLQTRTTTTTDCTPSVLVRRSSPTSR